MFGLFKSQVAFTVHEEPQPKADRDERAERLKFVREGFSLFAFIAPPLWMLANRLWLVLIGYLVILAAILTPPDVFSQLAMAIPVTLLYITSVLAAMLATRGRDQDDDPTDEDS